MSRVAFQNLIDDVMKIHAVGIEKFYGRFDPDPWAAAFSDVDSMITPGVSDATIRNSLAVLKAKRTKMVELYREYQYLTGNNFQMQASWIEQGFTQDEQHRRMLLKCDGCGVGMWKAKELTFKVLEAERDGVVHRNVVSDCPDCAQITGA